MSEVIKEIKRKVDGEDVIDQIIVDDIVINTDQIFIDGNKFQGSSENDNYIINSEKDVITELENGGIDSVSSIVSYTLNSNIENLTLADVVKKEIINGTACLVYGNPDDNRWNLDFNQDDDGIVKICDATSELITTENIKYFLGDCGITCVENILIQAGKISNETHLYTSQLPQFISQGQRDLRQSVLLAEMIKNEMCIYETINEERLGGTYGGILMKPNISSILTYYGISNHVIYNFNDLFFLENIAESIKTGKGVILGVDSGELWGSDLVAFTSDHAITVTGVAYEENTNNIKYFYICDSGNRNKARRISIEEMRLIVTLNSSAIITNESIKPINNDINGTGNELDNVIKGNIGNNILKGEDGNDVLVGNDGNDIIYSGNDDDVLIAGSAKKSNSNDEKEDLTNEELKDLINQKDNIDASQFETEDKDGKHYQNELYGESGDDLLIGDRGDDYLNGGSDNDYLYGGKGDDVLVGGEGQDVIHGNEGRDVLIAGNHNNIPIETLKRLKDYKSFISNVEQYESEAGQDSELYGDEEDDLLIGDKGDDNLYGGKDNDYLYGGRGNDNLYGEDNDDHLYGGEGDDELDGGDGDDTLEAGEGNYKDTLKGGKGNDKLITQNGNNQLEGGEDNDTYEANGGINNIEDESGFDTYKLTHSGSYVINDHDRSGQVFLSGAFVYGSPNNEPITDGYWEENGISYRWAGAGSTLFINNNIQIKNFYNGDYGINLREKDPEPEEPEDADNLDSEPIVLDLNGDGVRTTSKNQGINVDINGDGFAERVAWADINDGVLVADKNNNGIIDDESEIITAETLASYDTNNDGKIDSNDENYSELKVAKVDGSMQSLEDAGVESIDTNVNQTDYTDENGNYRFGEGSFTRTDGSVGSFGEYYFDTDYKNTVEKEILPETTTVQKLPDIKSRGTLHSLHQAMLRDSDLTALIQDFVNSNDDNHRHELIEQILNKWAGCEDVDVTSRGDFVNAKHLAIWEALMGKPFVSTNPGEENPLNPNNEAAEIIETVYTRLKVEVYAQLMKQSHFSMYMDLIGESVNGKYDLTALVNVLNDAITVNEEVGKNLVVQVAEMLLGLNIMYNSNYFDPFEDNCFYTKFTENDRELKWLLDSIGKNITDPIVKDMGDYNEDYGTAGSNAMRDEDETAQHTYHSLEGNDALYGGSADDYFAGCNGRDIVDGGDGDDHLLGNAHQDWIFGGKGNDILLGGSDNDILFGGDGDDIIYPDLEGEVDEADRVHGTGNDIIKGGKGNDTVYSIFGNETYIFNPGDGQDTISDISGTDIIYFGDGISWDDLTFEQNLNDLIIRINNSEDSITIVNWFFRTTLYDYSNNFKVEMFKFADGSIHYKNEIPIETDVEAFQFIGSDNDDGFKTGDFYKNYVNAGRGNDYVEAGAESDDTYVYNIGDGYDTILDNGGNDTILLGEGITQENIRFRRNENSLEMYFEGIDGNINILNTSNMIEKIVLADGTVIDDISQYLTCDISYTSYIMGDNLYELKLLGGASKNVLGNNSNNRIEGGEGSHVIAALGGDDEICCEKGSSDTYIYNIGDGNDNITDFNGFDNVIFGEGITTENIRFERHDNNLSIYFDGFEGSIYINNYFTNEGRIENFVFADGTVLDDIDNRLFAIGSNNDDIYLPEGATNAYLWGEADISATGNSQDNWFSGNSGNNTYQGREGKRGTQIHYGAEQRRKRYLYL